MRRPASSPPTRTGAPPSASTPAQRSRTATSGASARGSCWTRITCARTSRRASGPSRSAPSFTAARLARIVAGSSSADQGGTARPATHRRDREHLRGRGALARADPSAAARRASSTRARSPGSTARFARPSGGASSCRARRCGTTRRRTATAAGCSTSSTSTAVCGEPCDRCGTPIERTVVAGRGTWLCPRCQRA